MSDEWVETTLGDCFTLVKSKSNPEAVLPTRKYVGLEHLEELNPRIPSNGLVGDVTSQVSEFNAGDTLFGRLRPYLRKVAMADFDGYCSPEILVLRPNAGVVEQGYLHLLASSDIAIEHAVAVSAGSRMPRTSAADLAALPVSLPPLPVQRRIVDLLAHLDAHIANLRTEREALGAAVVAFRATTWDQLGMPLTPLGDLLHGIAAGRSPNTSGERPRIEEPGVLKVNAVDPSGTFFPEEAKVLPDDHGLSPDWELRGGEVLVTRANTAERVAAVARVPSPIRPGLFLCDKTLRLDYDSEVVDPDFLVEMLLSPQARRQVSVMATGVGSSMVNLSQAKFRTWEIPVPSLDEQLSIAATSTAMKSTVAALDAELRRLGSLRLSLLRGLLEGTVSPNPSYDGLLERVA